MPKVFMPTMSAVPAGTALLPLPPRWRRTFVSGPADRVRLVEDELMARFEAKRHVRVRDALAQLESCGPGGEESATS